MSTITDRDHAELLMLYQVTVDDIERAKQRGWRVAYTTIAANGTILALFSTYKDSELVLDKRCIYNSHY